MSSSEDNVTLTLPASLAEAFGAPKALVYFEALNNGAIIHGVWDGEREIKPTAEQENDLVTMIVARQKDRGEAYGAIRVSAPRAAGRVQHSRQKAMHYRPGSRT
jgi:hypothetical protein